MLNIHISASLPLPFYGWDIKFDLLAKGCKMNESRDQSIEIVDHFL